MAVSLDERAEALPLHDCQLVNLADVEAQPLEWLWPGRFPLGKLCLIGGKPSLGKSQISLSMASIVTTGGRWPFTNTNANSGDVLILSTEDDVADTIKPRLLAARADVSKVHMLESVTEANEDTTAKRLFNLNRHIDQLSGVLKENRNIRLIILDPLSGYLGVRDAHRDADVREVLGPLAALASEFNVSVYLESPILINRALQMP